MLGKGRDEFLARAEGIGEHLCETALWRNEACTWMVATSQSTVQGEARIPAGPNVYQGTAGISWFLSQLYRVSMKRRHRETAVGAMEHALDGANEIAPDRIGFHTGRVGIAYAAVVVGQALDREDFVSRGFRLLAEVQMPIRESVLDVIGGSAGAILALLALARMPCGKQKSVDQLALALSEHLVSSAHREPFGWSWPSVGIPVIRHLGGYAHGASGFGHALYEAAVFFDRREFEYAAERAFDYERQLFDPSSQNWLDMRHEILGKYWFKGRIQELRRLLAEGEALPQAEPKKMNAWCHGAPGVAIARLRAFALTGRRSYREEALIALRTTAAAVTYEGWNFSLCHGVAGNSEVLRYGALVLKRPALEEIVKRTFGEAVARHRAGTRWITGTVDGTPDPSLMLGESGIGLTMLRLAGVEAPSPTVMTGRDGRYRPDLSERSESDDLRNQDVRRYFGGTLGILEQEAKGRRQVREIINGAGRGGPPVAVAYERIRQVIRDLGQVSGAYPLEKVFYLEQTRYEMTIEITDFAEEMLWTLTPVPSVAAGVRYRLASWVRLVKSIELGPNLRTAVLPSRPPVRWYLLYRQRNQIVIWALKSLTAEMFRAFRRPRTVSRVFQDLRTHETSDAWQSVTMKEYIYEQVQEGLNARILVEAEMANR